MSDVYKFKAMSEVESLAEPTDTTTLLAVENGSVKQIPASAVGGSGGGGGGGSLIVNLTLEVGENGPVITSADKSFAELMSAIESGIIPFAMMGADGLYYVLALAMAAAGEAMLFAVVAENSVLNVMCMADDSWQLIMPSAEG